jgi:hypothetical protein
MLGRLVCVNADKAPNLTEGRGYDAYKASYGFHEDVVLVDDDRKVKQGYAMRRFAGIPKDGSVLAIGEES